MRSRFTSLLFVATFLFATTAAYADSTARIVRLSYLEGDVQLDRGDGTGYIRAFLNMPLLEGAAVSTTSSGRAEIEFEDGSTIRLIPNTTVFFTQLRLRDDGSKLTYVDLRDGTAYFDVRQRDEDDFRVLGAGRELSLDKTSEFRVSHSALLDPIGLRASVFKGELRFLGQDGQRTSIRKNESLTLDFADAGRYFLARGIAEEAHDYWDRERDRARQSENVHYARASNTTVIYVSDLDRHGSFFTVAGYGRLWRPHTFGVPWDPFDSGSWVYYPGHGFVYVSDYAWGWAPFRYGSWVHIRSRGWCWRPGNGYNTWTPGPVIVNAPAGYVVPTVPVVPVVPRDRVGPRGVIRVGQRVPLDGPGYVDGTPVGSSGGGSPLGSPIGSPILVQDRVQGVRQVNRISPVDAAPGVTATGESTGVVSPVRTDSERRVNRGSPSEGGTVTTTGTTIKTGERQSRSDGYIGTQRVTDVPVTSNPVPGGVTPAPVAPSQDRPGRPSRFEPSQPVQTVPTPSSTPYSNPTPVMNDRPARTSRVDAPVTTPTPSPTPMMNDRPARTPRYDAPAPQPQPQRMAPSSSQPSAPQPMRTATPPPSSPPPARTAPPAERPAPVSRTDSPQL
ncbi:MAG: DUF6600 domain-containing protein [Terriglobales bacterium]